MCMKHNTIVAIVIIILAIIVILAFGGVFGKKGNPSPAGDNQGEASNTVGSQNSSSGGSQSSNGSSGGLYSAETCPGIKITSPTSGKKVTFPLTVTGIVHPVAANASQWVVFEGEAGTVSIRGNNVDELVASPVIIRLQEDWMNTNPKSFTATIPSRINPKYSNKATLVFQDADASGQNQHACVVPITI